MTNFSIQGIFLKGHNRAKVGLFGRFVVQFLIETLIMLESLFQMDVA